MCVYAHMCGGQKLVSAVSEFLFSLFFETESPTGLKLQLGWLPENARDPLYLPP